MPQFVIDVIEDYKEKGKGLYDLTVLTTNGDYNNWFLDDNDNQTAADKFELVAEAWFFGYEIRKEGLFVINIGRGFGLNIYLRNSDKSLYPYSGDWRITSDIRYAKNLLNLKLTKLSEILILILNQDL